MSKVLNATCSAGIVLVDGTPIENVEILSEGVGPSEGILILDGEKSYYVPKSVEDIASTLGHLSDALEKLIDALTIHDTAGFLVAGPTPSPPLITTQITALGVVKTQVDLLVETLK